MNDADFTNTSLNGNKAEAYLDQKSAEFKLFKSNTLEGGVRINVVDFLFDGRIVIA